MVIKPNMVDSYQYAITFYVQYYWQIDKKFGRIKSADTTYLIWKYN